MRRFVSLLLCFVLLLSACSGSSGSTWQQQYDLAMQYLEDGRYEDAILAFQAAILIDPKRAEVYLGLAEAYIAQGDEAKATEVLTDALDVVDDASAVQAKLAELADEAPDGSGTSSSAQSVDSSAESGSDSIPDTSSSESSSSDSETEPLTWQQFYDRGTERLQKGEYQGAVEDFQAAVDLDPSVAGEYLGLADAYIGLGDPRRAIYILKHGMPVVADTEEMYAKMEELERTVEIPWKDAYYEYIGNREAAIDPNGPSAGQERYRLVDILHDDIPELYIMGEDTMGGDLLCTFYNGTLSENQISSGVFTYLEGQNLFCVTSGRQGVYFDHIYSFQEGQIVQLHEGYYETLDLFNPQFDEDGNEIYTYKWDGTDVASREEYYSLLNGVYDTDRATEISYDSLMTFNDIVMDIDDAY